MPRCAAHRREIAEPLGPGVTESHGCCVSVNEYRLEELLGVGTFGNVFLGINRRDEVQSVAIKLVTGYSASADRCH